MARKNENPIKRAYTYSEVVRLWRFCSAESQNQIAAALDAAKKPGWFAGKETPENLNLLSYGALDDLATIAKRTGVDPMLEAVALIMDVDKETAALQNAFDVFGLGKWIAKEVERINKLFAAISPHYSSEEVAAGVRSLNFGSFGVLDWYAHRQGIADQNQVRDVAWVRIYTCMANDNAKAEYEKRLNKQYQQKYKARNGRNHV